MTSLFVTTEVNHRRTSRTLRRRLPLIVICALLLAAVGFGVGIVLPKSYTAVAEVILARPIAGPLLGATTSSNDAARAAATEFEVINSDTVLLPAQKAAGHDLSVTVSAITGTDVAQVAATATSAETAAKDANAYVKAYTDLRTGQLKAIYSGAVRSLAAQVSNVANAIKPLDAQVSAASSGGSSQLQLTLAVVGPARDALLKHKSELENRLDDLTLRNDVAGAAPQTAAAATPPPAPSTLKPALFAGLGLIGGLLLGVSLALGLERRRGRVYDEEDVRNAGVEVPLVASLPGGGSGSGILLGAAQTSPAAAAYRRAAAAMTMGLPPNAEYTLTVLPVDAASVTTTPACNLALALASLGRNVVLVDLDLDRPSLHRLFGIEGHIGLNTVLQGDMPVSEAVGQVRNCDLLLLPAGARVTGRSPNISKLPEVLDELRRNGHVLVLAAAATVASAIAITVLPLADTIALTASPGEVRTTQLSDAAEFLQGFGQSLSAILLVPPPQQHDRLKRGAKPPSPTPPSPTPPSPTPPPSAPPVPAPTSVEAVSDK